MARQDVVWVLGAQDPEMTAIENLLRECGQVVVHATSDAVLYGRPGTQRVHGGNAYRATSMSEYPPDTALYVFVECDVPDMSSYIEHARCDHHRPGDPGYGASPSRYMAGSSLGQVISRLAHMGRLPESWTRRDMAYHNGVGFVTECDGAMHVVADRLHDSDPDFAHIPWAVLAEIPRSLVLTAAADHCLAAAYQGLCPGISVDDLLRHRVEEKATFQKRSVESVLGDIEVAKRALRDAPKLFADGINIANCRNSILVVRASMACDGTGEDTFFEFGTSPGLYCDGIVETQRFVKPIPELPEAACIMGVPFLSDVTEPSGRRKVALQGVPAGSRLVEWFMAGELVPGLIDYYGDPARGFAGGYVTQSGG